MEIISKLSDACLDFFFPKKSSVLSMESMSGGELLSIIAPARDNTDGIVSIFSYEDPLARDLIWELKYAGNRKIAEKLGEVLYDLICDELYEKNAFTGELSPLLVPVPISDKRRYERGWNQTELLCEAIKKCDKAQQFKYLPRQLTKFVHTESQTHTQGKKEREENIKNSMKVLNPQKIEGRYIVLIDDVSTTGATLREAKRALKSAGAKEILSVTIAH